MPSSWFWKALRMACLGLVHVGGIVAAGAHQVGRGGELVEDLAHVHGVAVLLGVPALGGSGGLHAHQGGGGHLAAGHAVDAVVDEDDSDVLSTVGGGDGLSQADGGEVAVPLIGEHQRIGVGALHAGGHGAGPAVGGGGVVVGDVVHVQAAAADAQYAGGLLHQVHLLQHLADELDDGGVHAAGAEAGDLVFLDGFGSRIDQFHLTSPP